MKGFLRAPFPYFGGKASVANIVWQALGEPRHYIEPFFGSGAVLLARPNYDPQRHVETVNDKDGFVCNVWRALQSDPDEVARWCDWPVNHADLAARRRVLIANEQNLLANLINDDKWYDAKIAGYWIWAASCWIGGRLTKCSKGSNAVVKRPDICQGGVGVHALGARSFCGIIDKSVQEPHNTNIYTWFRQLSERLRYVRVVCGDWKQVCGGKWQTLMGACGMFFDPPYGVTDRDSVYHCDGYDVASAVRQWCLERGNDPQMRIVLAGYDEHNELLDYGWTAMNWKAQGGYANISRNGKTDNRGKVNRKREMLYFSPHCRKTDLFNGA